MQAMQIQWYHLYKPEAYYPVILTQYGGDVSDFDYDEINNCTSVDELKRIQKSYTIGQNQKVAIKFQTRLSNVIWEAKLRGFSLGSPSFRSDAKNFKIDPNNPTIILPPLTSLTGVGEIVAKNAVASIKEDGPITSYEDLLTRKYNGKIVFNKKILLGFGLFELTEREQEIFNNDINNS